MKNTQKNLSALDNMVQAVRDFNAHSMATGYEIEYRIAPDDDYIGVRMQRSIYAG